ncbi:MAG: IclR family transcriptional regulator [Rhodocyclaceae bacterium]
MDRACAVLAVFAVSEDALTLAELARRTGFYKSTLLRLLASLARAGIARQLEDGRYGPGAQAMQLARAYQRSFRLDDVLLPILRHLCEASGETASLFVRDGDARLCLRRIEPDRSIRIALHEGDRLPLSRGSAGRVLTAFADDQDPAAALAEVRRRGWAYTQGERDPDAASVAAVVFGQGQQVVGALALSGPRQRFDAVRIRSFASLALHAAARLSAALGGQYPAHWLEQEVDADA